MKILLFVSLATVFSAYGMKGTDEDLFAKYKTDDRAVIEKILCVSPEQSGQERAADTGMRVFMATSTAGLLGSALASPAWMSVLFNSTLGVVKVGLISAGAFVLPVAVGVAAGVGTYFCLGGCDSENDSDDED